MARRKLSIDIQIEHKDWKKAWPALKTDIRAIVDAAVAHDGVATSPILGALGIVLGDDVRLQSLNALFRGKDKPTNVLSFPDPDLPPGGIAVSCETVAREAKAQDKNFINHAKHMILHGFLHLLGHDHIKARDARLMEGLEIAILGEMGIPNPYHSKVKSRV